MQNVRQTRFTEWGSGVFVTVIVLAALMAVLFLFYHSKKMKKSLIKEKELAKNLEAALKEAECANKAKMVFLRNMSHDIRTPMNAIIGFADIAKKRNKDEEVDKFLSKITLSTEHLLTIINDVLDISRIESGADVVNPVQTDLCALTDTVLAVIQGYIGGRSLKLEIERLQDRKFRNVVTDPVCVREILVNILSNAVKFTDDGGRIIFSMDNRPGEDDEHILIQYRISDTGSGMSEDYLPNLFDIFTQEDNNNARTTYRGTGLGMAITKHYVDMLNGTITVDSKKGEGTTFVVEIPVQLVNEPEEQKPGNYGKRRGLSGINVLLAEDNDINAEIVMMQLNELGMNVTRAANGKEAVTLFEKSAPGGFDLIVMDIMMPEMNGYDAARAIRALKDRADACTVPVVAMTANAFAEDIQAAMNAGMNAHIAKPIMLQEVISTLQRVLESAS